MTADYISFNIPSYNFNYRETHKPVCILNYLRQFVYDYINFFQHSRCHLELSFAWTQRIYLYADALTWMKWGFVCAVWLKW